LTKPPLPAKKNIFGESKSMNKVTHATNGMALAPHNSTQQTWPISPIPVAGGSNFVLHGGQRDCDSPMVRLQIGKKFKFSNA
jgi:hypothetical protein